MASFVAETRSGQVLNLRAKSIEQAAQHAARRLYGQSASADRVTGLMHKSGWFQAYRAIPGTLSVTSVGEPFFVNRF